MSSDAEIVPPSAAKTPASVLARVQRLLGRLCVIAFSLGLLASAVAWLLPLRTSASIAYESLFMIAFFARVYLLPVSAAWIALAGVSLLCRRWRMAILSGLIAVAWAMPELWLMMSRSPAISGPTFSIGSFNLNKELKDARDAVASMRAMDADFIVCQEVSPHIAGQLQAALGEQYPHALIYPDDGYDGAAIFSRTPLTLIEAPTGMARRNLTCTAISNGRALTLVNDHLASPNRMENRRVSREQTLAMINDYSAAKTPVLLIGDFNFTTYTPQGMALASAGFIDAHRHTGNGRQTTWPTAASGLLSPRVRIDTAYTRGEGIEPVRTQTGHDHGSDHLPIKVTFR